MSFDSSFPSIYFAPAEQSPSRNGADRPGATVYCMCFAHFYFSRAEQPPSRNGADRQRAISLTSYLQLTNSSFLFRFIFL